MQQESSITINYDNFASRGFIHPLAFATPLPQCFHKLKYKLIEELQVVDLLLL